MGQALANQLQLTIADLAAEAHDTHHPVAISKYYEEQKDEAREAAGRAKPLFLDAIAAMTLRDVIDIWQGPQDAATRYFEGQMTPALRRSFAPVRNLLEADQTT